MNRTLRRPMFRTGGSAEGITSGLAPRQGYADPPGKVEQLGDIRNMTIPQLKELAGQMSYKPRGTNVYDFMIGAGLDIASRPPAPGGIIPTVAQSVKEPYEKYLADKSEADLQGYASESDMFKTLIGAQADILGSESGGKTYEKQVVADMIDGYIRSIDKNEELLKDPTLSADKKKEITLQIQSDKTNLRKIKGKNIYAEAVLKSDKYVKGFIDTIMEKLKKKTKADGTKMYPDPDNNPDLYNDAYSEFVSYFEEEYATGGRVGYQNAGAVMSGAMPTDQEAPPELQNIDYETLRARLPATITDDIVRLIASSAEAMEDFATIQTQQDVENFNNKYSVELVLPAEA